MIKVQLTDRCHQTIRVIKCITCFLVRVLPVRNLMYLAINSFLPEIKEWTGSVYWETPSETVCVYIWGGKTDTFTDL